jgi:hypothetical protein
METPLESEADHAIRRLEEGANLDPIEELLIESGLVGLTASAKAAEQERALQALAIAVASLAPLRRIIVRDRTIQALKRGGFESPAKLVDAALSVSVADEPSTDAGSDLLLAAPLPWAEAVDGATLLTEIEEAIAAHAVLPEGAAVAMALWVVHTYCVGAAAITPRLAIVSPTKRCGKTTVLKLLGALACKPLAAATLTPAVLYRVVEAFAPTILVDEADTFLAEQDELRGVLNAGHDRHSAVVPRCVGDEFEPRVFHVFGAVAIAAIGKLPDTLMDRSIVVQMKRKGPGERVQKLRRRQREALSSLPRRCARWAADYTKTLSDREPEIPDELDDRAADNWEPLLAIADQAGGPWPSRARTTALLLSGARADPRITMEFYGHLAPGYLRNAIDRLAINPAEPDVQPQPIAASATTDSPPDASDSIEFAAPLLQPLDSGDLAALGAAENSPAFADLDGSGIPGSNRRHLAWEHAEATSGGVAPGSSPSQATDFVRGEIGGGSRGVPAVAPVRQIFAAPLLQGSRALGVMDGGRGGDPGAPLKVRDVAAQLGVCTATVYQLVGEGHLPHVRVLNAIP